MEQETAAQNLRLQDFRSRELAGTDYEGCDVRSADFGQADLRGASFKDARLGVAPGRGAIILGAGFAVAVAAGIVIGWAIADTSANLTSSEVDRIAEGGSLIVMFALLIGLIVWRGFDVAWKVTAIAYVAVVGANIIGNLLFEQVDWTRVARFTLIVVALVLAVVTGVVGRLVGSVFGSWSIAVVALAGGLASGQANGGIAGILVAVSLVFISKRAMRGDQRDQTLRAVAHAIARRWGTSFAGANLTNADFTGATVAGSDFRGAKLDGVQWEPSRPPPRNIDR
jgi:uncharacterized protein YjbI with pentapeptide repeats